MTALLYIHANVLNTAIIYVEVAVGSRVAWKVSFALMQSNHHYAPLDRYHLTTRPNHSLSTFMPLPTLSSSFRHFHQLTPNLLDPVPKTTLSITYILLDDHFHLLYKINQNHHLLQTPFQLFSYLLSIHHYTPLSVPLFFN